MIEKVHEHIITELQQNARTDTIFVQTAIILNLLTLAINSAIAETSRGKTNVFIAMFIFVSLTVVVNLVVISGLLRGKQTRIKLLNGLMKMYKDQGVEGYYDPAILFNYNARYNLFILTVAFLGLIAIVVPFVIR
jgi:sensor c-di-GMP phosphodiesterase-like protein